MERELKVTLIWQPLAAKLVFLNIATTGCNIQTPNSKPSNPPLLSTPLPQPQEFLPLY
jgi:hypothetical protein